MSNTNPILSYSISPSVTGIVLIPDNAPARSVGEPSVLKLMDTEAIESAVYAYIQAVRALGKIRLNTSDIAKALKLSIGDVNEAISSMKDRGVKVV